MALTVSYETPYGITCASAYCVISETRCSREMEMNIVDEEETTTKTFPISYNGKIYASLEAYNDDASPIGGFNGRFELDIDDDNIQYNIIKQCYLHLKTTDDFTDAIDA